MTKQREQTWGELTVALLELRDDKNDMTVGIALDKAKAYAQACVDAALSDTLGPLERVAKKHDIECDGLVVGYDKDTDSFTYYERYNEMQCSDDMTRAEAKALLEVHDDA